MMTAAQIAYLRDAYAPRIYLVEFDAYDLTADSTKTLYYSTTGFTSLPGDSPSNTHFEGRVKSALNVSRNMYSPGKIGGRSVPAFGTIKLNNVDGYLDFLQGYSLNGRNIKVKVGSGGLYSDFFNIFVGTMDQIEWSSTEVTIKIRDFQHKLDKDIETDTYTGTIEVTGTAQAGGTSTITLASSASSTHDFYKYMDIEVTGGTGYDQKRKIIAYNGSTKVATTKSSTPWTVNPDNTSLYSVYNNSNGEDRLKDKVKPLCYGDVSHIEPIEIDPSNRKYQVHNGAVEEIVGVYAGGNQLGSCSSGSYTNAWDCQADGYTWTNSGFTPSISTGTFTLVGSATTVITADVKGSKESDAFNASATYVSKTGDLVKRIVTTKGGIQVSGIDTSSFNDFDVATTAIKNGDVGYYVPEGGNILNVLDDLISSLGGFYSFSREGKLVIGVLTEPSATPVESFTEHEIMSIQRRSTSIPTLSQTTGSRRYWRQFSENDLAGAVLSDEPYKARLESQFVDEEYSGTNNISTRHLLAEAAEKIDTYLNCNCMGYEEAKRRQELYGVERDLFIVKVKTQPFMLDINSTVQIKLNRYGLDNGKNMRVVSLKEDASKNEVTMEVWG